MKTKEDILKERKIKWVENVYNKHSTEIEKIYEELRSNDLHTHFFEDYSDAEEVKEYLEDRGFFVSEIDQDFWRNNDITYIEVRLEDKYIY